MVIIDDNNVGNDFGFISNTRWRIDSFCVLRQSFCGKFEFSAESGHPGHPLLECMIASNHTVSSTYIVASSNTIANS